MNVANSQNPQNQLSMQVNKQEIIKIQDQNYSLNIMGRILSYAENYANFNKPDKNFKKNINTMIPLTLVKKSH